MSAEDASLAAELHEQLQEQIHGLAEVEEALEASPDDADLLSLKAQLEQGIVQLRDSLAEVQQDILQQQQQLLQPGQQQDLSAQVYDDDYEALQQQQQEQQAVAASWDKHLGQQQQQDHVRPHWLLPGVRCRFRYSDGLWHPGLVHEWLPQQQLPVSVHFAYPTRHYMLHELLLPLGLVQPDRQSAPSSGSNAAAGRSSSRRQVLSVGSRVLVLPRGSSLWQAAEVTAIQQPAPAAAAADAAMSQDESSRQQKQQQQQLAAARYTVELVGQQRSLAVHADYVVLARRAAAVALEQLEADTEEEDPADAAGDTSGASSGRKRLRGLVGNGGSSSGSDMSMSSAGSESGDGSDGEAGGSSDSSESEEERHLGGIGDVLDHARAAAEAGVQSETVTFAAWEESGRGIASKLMARMGFKRGAGLGRQGRGIKDPLEIVILPSRKGLGAAAKHKAHKAAGTGARNSSTHHGNKVSSRTRKRLKAAARRHAAKAGDKQRQARMEAATGEQGLFAFINDSLGHGSEAVAKLQEAGLYMPCDGGKGGTRQQQTRGGAALAAAAAAAAAVRAAGSSGGAPQQKLLDRKGLVGSQDDLSALKARVTQLAAMLERNKTNKGLAPQIQAKLSQAKREYEAAAAQHKQLSHSVAQKEATKKWMRF